MLTDKVGRLHHTLEEHVHTNTQLLADNSQRQVEIKAKEDEIRALRVSRWPQARPRLSGGQQRPANGPCRFGGTSLGGQPVGGAGGLRTLLLQPPAAQGRAACTLPHVSLAATGACTVVHAATDSFNLPWP